jgi:hypothetical protein
MSVSFAIPETIMRQCVGLAHHADADAVNALRLELYSQAREFRLLRPEKLVWNGCHDDGAVAAGWDADGRLISTMQSRFVATRAQAEEKLGISVELDESWFPAVILSRAATARGHGRSGLNSVLRWHMLRAAQAGGSRSLLGLVYADAPRLNLMRELGYHFRSPGLVWDDEVEPIQPPLLAHLAAAGFPAALAKFEASAAETIASYPWRGPALVIPA